MVTASEMVVPHAKVDGGFTGRVLYVARAPFISGAERALMSMLRHLDRSRVHPALVLGYDSPLVKEAEAMGVPVTVIALPKRGRENLLGWRKSLRQLGRVIRSFDPHVLHANDVPSCQAISNLGGKLAAARLVHVRWGVTAKEAAWWARSGAEGFICISQWVRDQFGDPAGTSIARAQLDVIPDAVDWPATEDAGTAMAMGMPDLPGVDPSRPAIGFAGQLIETKGLDLVIEAMGRMPADRRPQFLIAGEDTQRRGAYKELLQNLAMMHHVTDRVTWMGFLPDISDLYRRVNAVVCPSRVEPLGLIPLEAARFNVPALANRVGGFVETIVDGQSGWLVEPTVEAWASALDVIWDRQAIRSAGAAAHERTRELYSPKVYQDRLMATYYRVTHPRVAAV